MPIFVALGHKMSTQDAKCRGSVKNVLAQHEVDNHVHIRDVNVAFASDIGCCIGRFLA